MKDFLMQRRWSWLASGLALGLCFFLAVAFVKPIGVSTQFVIFDAILWDAVSDEIIVSDPAAKNGYSSPNAYLNTSGGKYAKNAAEPLNYSFVFVLAMVLGGFVANKMSREKSPSDDAAIPPVWSQRFGDAAWKRHLGSFLGGLIVLYGARLAGGCDGANRVEGGDGGGGGRSKGSKGGARV